MCCNDFPFNRDAIALPEQITQMKSIILTCEHGGNDIPESFQPLFKGHESVLRTHRGWDIGALAVAKLLSHELDLPIFYATTSRLLVELNRSLHHPGLFSSFSRSLSQEEKLHALKRFYYPYRNEVEENIRKIIREKTAVFHISVHSFTPVLNDRVRNVDIGLLYDPAVKSEKDFCKKWKTCIKSSSDYRVRFNYPYKGTADGFTTYLRKQFPKNYSGVELEINQQLLEEKTSIATVSSVLIQTLKAL